MTAIEDVSDGPITYPKGTPRQRKIAADAIREARRDHVWGAAAFGYAADVLARRTARFAVTSDREHTVDLAHAFVLVDAEHRKCVERMLNR